MAIDQVRNRRSFNKEKTRAEDQRVTVCSDCTMGIFNNQKYSWVKGRGLSHNACIDKRRDGSQNTT